MVLRFPALFVGTYPTGIVAIILGSIFILPTAGFLSRSRASLFGNEELELDEEEDEDEMPAEPRRRVPTAADFSDEDEGFRFTDFVAFGALAHTWYTTQARFRRLFRLKPKSTSNATKRPMISTRMSFGTLNEPVRPKARAGSRLEPSLDNSMSGVMAARRRLSPPSLGGDDDFDDDGDMPMRPSGNSFR